MWGSQSKTTDTTIALPAVAVLTTATVLDASSPPAMFGNGCTVYNDGPNTCYLGGEDVTSTTGFPIASGGSFDLVALPSRTWAICAPATTATLRVVGG